MVPDCNVDHSKQGQSKGGILAKACEYITELTDENNRFHEVIQTNNNLINDLERTKRDLAETKKENNRLREILRKHGLSSELAEAVGHTDSNLKADVYQETNVITSNGTNLLVPPSVVVTLSSNKPDMLAASSDSGSGHISPTIIRVNTTTSSPTPSS